MHAIISFSNPNGRGTSHLQNERRRTTRGASASLLLGNVDLKAVTVSQLRGILSKFGTHL